MTGEEIVRHSAERVGQEHQLLRQLGLTALDYKPFAYGQLGLEAFVENPAEDFTPDFEAPRQSLRTLIETYYAFDYYDHIDEVPGEITELVSDILTPLTGIKTEEESIEAQLCPHDHCGSCVDAEEYFNQSLRQINTGIYSYQDRLSVYHTSEGVPIALKKFRDSRSALTLSQIAIGKIILPKGTFVRMRHIGVGAEMTGRSEHEGYELATYVVDKPYLAPLRISPWAYDDMLDRALFATQARFKTVYAYPKRLNTVTRYTLQDFQAGANRVMEACGLASRNSLVA